MIDLDEIEARTNSKTAWEYDQRIDVRALIALAREQQAALQSARAALVCASADYSFTDEIARIDAALQEVTCATGESRTPTRSSDPA